MIKKVIGSILMGIGFIGFFYFKSYNGEIIPFPILWFLLSFVVFAFGGYFAFSSKSLKQVHTDSKLSEALSKLRENGEKIVVDFDNCEFRTNHFTREVISESSSRIQMLDAMYDSNRNYKTEAVKQTVIVYNHKNGQETEKFISQNFHIEEMTLKYYVSKGDLILYVDKFDRKNYLFEFNTSEN